MIEIGKRVRVHYGVRPKHPYDDVEKYAGLVGEVVGHSNVWFQKLNNVHFPDSVLDQGDFFDHELMVLDG